MALPVLELMTPPVFVALALDAVIVLADPLKTVIELPDWAAATSEE